MGRVGTWVYAEGWCAGMLVRQHWRADMRVHWHTGAFMGASAHRHVDSLVRARVSALAHVCVGTLARALTWVHSRRRRSCIIVQVTSAEKNDRVREGNPRGVSWALGRRAARGISAATLKPSAQFRALFFFLPYSELWSQDKHRILSSRTYPSQSTVSIDTLDFQVLRRF